MSAAPAPVVSPVEIAPTWPSLAPDLAPRWPVPDLATPPSLAGFDLGDVREGQGGALPGRSDRCPPGAVLVEGEYCPVVDERCTQWDEGSRSRCLHFEQPTRCLTRRRHLSFCIDRYEWPNREGARPAVMVTWEEAAAQCRTAGRRLCTQDEWTFACEGEAMIPYGYGYDRVPETCVVDHRARAPDRTLLGDWHREVALAEAERVYEAGTSGSHRGCVTPFGAFDMPGNVDEWTINESGHPYRSALKGGWWGRIRGRCRPATLAHYEHFRYYQIGFRCCAQTGSPAPP